MRSPLRSPLARPCLLATLLALASCGSGEPEYAAERGGASSGAPAPTDNTEPSTTTPDRPSEPVAVEPVNPTPSGITPERDLTEETGARSTLGRTRDSAKDLRNQLQGGVETSPLAITSPDENYVLVGGVRWEIPEGWRLAVPQDPQIKSEIGVPSAYGTGRITFTHTQTTPRAVLSFWSRLVLDDIGDAASPDTQTESVQGLEVTTALIEGTYTGDGNDRPFYAVRLVIVELGDGTAVAGAYVATQSHIEENRARWEQFVESMSVR